MQVAQTYEYPLNNWISVLVLNVNGTFAITQNSSVPKVQKTLIPFKLAETIMKLDTNS